MTLYSKVILTKSETTHLEYA